MTTPAQEAKDYAAQNGFSITPKDRRYLVTHGNAIITEVGGYPAALNAMKRYVEQALATSDPVETEIDISAMVPAIATGERIDDLAKLVNVPALSSETIRAMNDWITCKMGKDCIHPLADFPFDDPDSIERVRAMAAHRRTGYYVRITGQNGATLSDIWCGSLKEAYKCCASTAQHFKRIGYTPVTKRSVIFKRG